MNLWILTFSINEYNQEGAYFLTAWTSKPTFQILRQFFDSKISLSCPHYDVSDADIGRALRGEGRFRNQNLWYTLQQIKQGYPLSLAGGGE